MLKINKWKISPVGNANYFHSLVQSVKMLYNDNGFYKINIQKKSFISKYLHIFGFGFAHPVCKLKLLVTHDYSFYGSSLWDLYDNDSKKLYITWNIAVRSLYDLPRTAHTSFITHIAGVPHVNLNLKCRFAKFVYKAINSQIEKIAFLAKLCIYNTMSISCSNVSNILFEFNINMSDIINGSASNLMKIAYTGFNALLDELWKCDMILELTDCIYGFSNCSISYEEAKYCLCHVVSD